jgi:hypothetical protein
MLGSIWFFYGNFCFLRNFCVSEVKSFIVLVLSLVLWSVYGLFLCVVRVRRSQWYFSIEIVHCYNSWKEYTLPSLMCSNSMIFCNIKFLLQPTNGFFTLDIILCFRSFTSFSISLIEFMIFYKYLNYIWLSGQILSSLWLQRLLLLTNFSAGLEKRFLLNCFCVS